MSTPAPDANGSCSRDSCYAPETSCVLGKNPCENFSAAATQEGAVGSTGPTLPWSGLSLGLNDLTAVTATGRHRLVALVGLAEAGKTTALAAHWIAARRGGGRYGRAFAGSFTLDGWHRIARHLQWLPWGSGGFPPHTTASDRRSPSLLHMTLTTIGSPLHVLYTDVPGEWFRAWAYDAASVQGATWIADHADVFVVVADSHALAGPTRGEARADYEAIAERVASVARDRPVVPVRSKADVEVPSAVVAHIDEVNRRLFDAETTLVSVHERARAPITEAVDRAVDAAIAARKLAMPDEGVRGDFLLSYTRMVEGAA